MSAMGAAYALRAFSGAMSRARRLRERAALEAWQAKRLQRWLVQRAGVAQLSDLPIIDRDVLMSDFARFNTLGLTAEDATAIAEGRREAPAGYHVGLSTGTTSGVRMPYLISETERFVWLGTMLAKTLGWAAVARPRVAVALPRASSLYDAASDGRALPLAFASLGNGFVGAQRSIETFRPDVLVAPPRLLVWLAEQKSALSLKRVVAAAEVLDPPDRDLIREAFRGAVLGEVYMATEGLLAVSCRLGTLHLAEDCVHFDLCDAGGGTVEPVVTDFTRQTQMMARYRTGDLLRRVECPCGSPLQAVAVAGRASDRIGGIAPDVLRDAVLDTGVTDFRLTQTGNDDPVLTVADTAEWDAPRTALEALLSRPVKVEIATLSMPEHEKLRRVRRVP